MVFFDRDRFELALSEFKDKYSKLLLKVFIGLFFGFLGGFYYYGTTGSYARDIEIQNAMFEFRGKRTPPPELVIVGMDGEAYKNLKISSYFPIPRNYMAEAFEAMAEASPRVFILDGKLEPYPCSDPASDDRIAAALAKMPSTLWSGEEPEDEADPFTKEVFPADEKFRRAVKMELPMALLGVGGRRCFMCSAGDIDSPLTEKVPISRALIELGKYKIPKEPGIYDYVNYYGPHLTIPRRSIYNFINEDLKGEAKAFIKDKIVLFGAQSLSLEKGPWQSERFLTTVSDKKMFGVEVHANTVGNLIDGSFLSRLKVRQEQGIVAFIIAVLIAIALFNPSWKGVFVVIGGAVVVTLGAYLGFAYYNFWLGGIGTVLEASNLILVLCAVYISIERGYFDEAIKQILKIDVKQIRLRFKQKKLSR